MQVVEITGVELAETGYPDGKSVYHVCFMQGHRHGYIPLVARDELQAFMDARGYFIALRYDVKEQ